MRKRLFPKRDGLFLLRVDIYLSNQRFRRCLFHKELVMYLKLKC